MASGNTLNIPRSPFVDLMTGNVSQEWLLWLLNLNVQSINLSTALPATSGGTGSSLTPAAGQMLIGDGSNKFVLTNDVPASSGGTGNNSYVIGDILYADTTTTLARLPAGALGYSLASNGPGTAPSYQPLGLPTIANLTILSNIFGSSALPVGNTLTSLLDAILGNTQGQVITRNGSVWTVLNPGAVGTYLGGNGAGANVSYTAPPVFVASGASHAAGAVPDPGATAGTTRFLREDATFAVPPSSGGNGDITSTLVNTEVLVNGATTLTSASFGHMHNCVDSGTPASYTLTLPTATGNTGKMIGIRVSSSMTQYVTIATASPASYLLHTPSGAGGAFMNQVASRVAYAGETRVLMSDGTHWIRISGSPIPMVGSLRVANGGQSIPNATMTKVVYDRCDVAPFTPGTNADFFADVANNQFTILRPGWYEVSGQCFFNYSSASALMLIDVWVGGTQYNETAGYNTGAGQAIGKAGPLIFGFSAGSFVDMRVYQGTGATQTLQGLAGNNRPSYFNCKELDPW